MQSTGTLSLVLYGVFIVITLVALAVAFYHVIKGSLPKEKMDTLVELFKYAVVTMAVATVGSIVSDQFKERDQDVKELEYYHNYVDKITTLDGPGRLNLTKFLATVAPKGPMRDAWKSYYDTVQVEYARYLAIQHQQAQQNDSSTFSPEQFAATERKLQVVASFEQPLIATAAPAQPIRPVVYIQYCSDARKAPAAQLRQQLTTLGWSAPGIEQRPSGCNSTIRYFHDEDRPLAIQLQQQLGSAYTIVKPALKARKAQLEVWMGE